jgi:hypothetical protein
VRGGIDPIVDSSQTQPASSAPPSQKNPFIILDVRREAQPTCLAVDLTAQLSMKALCIKSCIGDAIRRSETQKKGGTEVPPFLITIMRCYGVMFRVKRWLNAPV